MWQILSLLINCAKCPFLSLLVNCAKCQILSLLVNCDVANFIPFGQLSKVSIFIPFDPTALSAKFYPLKWKQLVQCICIQSLVNTFMYSFVSFNDKCIVSYSVLAWAKISIHYWYVYFLCMFVNNRIIYFSSYILSLVYFI